MKECSRCKQVLPDLNFRVRKERRGREFTYLNNTCKKCDRDLAKIYHFKNKDNPFFKQKNRDRANRWRIEHIDYAIEYQRERIKTAAWKEYMKEYNKKNQDKIKVLSILRNRKYYYKIFNSISPVYAKSKLLHPRNGLSNAEISDEMITIKRAQIAINRIKRIIKKQKNEKQN